MSATEQGIAAKSTSLAAAKFDKAALTIRGLKSHADHLVGVSELLARTLVQIEHCLQDLRASGLYTEGKVSDDLRTTLEKLMGRLDRINELRRSCEMGSFGLEIKRFSDAAWRDLP